MSENKGIPTFTPPTNGVPTFTPPGTRGSFSGTSCFYHQGEPSVANCARCGKHLCRDCYEAYGVSSGEYANQALCYDCTQKLVAENVEELTANKKTIKLHFILSIIGIVIGAIIGLSAGLENKGGAGSAIVFMLLGAGIGGVFLSAVKSFFSILWESIKAGFSHGAVAGIICFFIAIFIAAFKCLWATIKNTFYYISYLKRTSGFIESDTEALQQMRDYMEYTRVRSQNKGVDLETLMSQGSELYNNSFAQMVRDQGEERATQVVSNAATRIAANGEIIRDFEAAA